MRLRGARGKERKDRDSTKEKKRTDRERKKEKERTRERGKERKREREKVRKRERERDRQRERGKERKRGRAKERGSLGLTEVAAPAPAVVKHIVTFIATFTFTSRCVAASYLGSKKCKRQRFCKASGAGLWGTSAMATGTGDTPHKRRLQSLSKEGQQEKKRKA